MPDIAMQIGIAAEPDTVYRALTTTEGIAGWWTTKNETAAKAGQTDRYWFPGVPMSYDMRVTHAEPDKALAWECVAGPAAWIGTSVRWMLAPGPDGGTLVLLDHTDFAAVDAMYRMVTLGWAQMILRLKEYAETGKPTPFFAE
jgi:uncharacterized protein YndB with AHSA1/START domain